MQSYVYYELLQYITKHFIKLIKLTLIFFIMYLIILEIDILNYVACT